jgi:hypothetical protein
MVYVNMPLVLLAPVVGPLIAPLALGDKILKLSVVAISPIQKMLQGSIPKAQESKDLVKRCFDSLKIVALLAIAFATSFAVLAPFAGSILTLSKINLGLELTFPLGIAFGAITLTGVIGLVYLPAIGRESQMILSVAIGVLVAVPSVAWALIIQSPVAMAWAIAATEVAVLAYQLLSFNHIAKGLKQ